MNEEIGTKKVNKKLLAFMESIATQKLWDDGHGNTMMSWYSKTDDSFITSVGCIEDAKWMLKKGITEQVQSSYPGGKTACIGFNSKEQKWFGWSHRAVFGFGIGSNIKKGNCGFEYSGEWTAKTLDEAKQMAINFAKSVS